MSILLALFLGIVQGLTEFLPVSSSGHLILFQHLFGLPEDMLMFNIILHVATLLAVVICFHKKIWQLVRRPFNKTNAYLIIATAVTCTLVVLFKDFIDSTFTYKVLPFTFMVTAVVLVIASIAKQSQGSVRAPSALLVGLTQFIAVIPGISRSGTTISTLLATGVKREDAAEFSFLMSIPIIIASFAYELLNVNGNVAVDVLPTAVAFIAALVSGVLAIKFMLGIIRRAGLYWFSIYLIALSLFCLFIL
jgi:undecaprenyl-diphosphatase